MMRPLDDLTGRRVEITHPFVVRAGGRTWRAATDGFAFAAVATWPATA